METALSTLQNVELNYGRQYKVPSAFFFCAKPTAHRAWQSLCFWLDLVSLLGRCNNRRRSTGPCIANSAQTAGYTDRSVLSSFLSLQFV